MRGAENSVSIINFEFSIMFISIYLAAETRSVFSLIILNVDD